MYTSPRILTLRKDKRAIRQAIRHPMYVLLVRRYIANMYWYSNNTITGQEIRSRLNLL